MENKNSFDKFIEKAKRESLSQDERTRMLSHINDFVKSHPLERVKSPYGGWMVLYKHHTMSVAFALILFFGAGGTAFAERALPGDWLYKIKVGVNEQIRGWFAHSPQAQAEWQLSLAERRFREIEELDNEHRLSPELNSRLQSNVELYTARALGEQISTFSRNTHEAPVSTEISEKASVALMADSRVSDVSRSVQLALESDFSLDDIVDLNKQIEEEKLRVKSKTDELRSLNSLIRTRAGLLMAERYLFEAKQVYMQGNIELAEQLFDDANSTLDSIDLGGFLKESPSKKETQQKESELRSVEDKDDEEGEAKPVDDLNKENSTEDLEIKVELKNEKDESDSDNSTKPNIIPEVKVNIPIPLFH